ncbi:MAG: ACT domain-containing protein [Actinomycetota bacterium]
MHQLSVTAVGKDRPGIVAAVTKVLYELGCNLDDCSMSLLSGQFTMIMVLDAPDDLGADQLAAALTPVGEQVGVTVAVNEVETVPGLPAAHPFVVSLYGADHPGIVYRVTSELAASQVNITNLVSRAMGERLYTVVLDIDVPETLGAARLSGKLQQVARQEGVELILRPADVETL